MSKVTPIQIGQIILSPIRHFFNTNPPAKHLYWDPDPKKTRLDISMFNDAHKETSDFDMQILVDRGTLQVNKTGLSDNLATQAAFETTKGLVNRTNFLMYQGTARIIVKARTEGNAELLTDMVMHILQWSRPHICDVLGFKEFALPMSISSPSVGKPDTETFQVEISVPYMFEELWLASNDGLKLRDFFISLKRD